MYLFDTDTTNLALRGHPRIITRIVATPRADLWLSAIAAEELLQGSLARINWERSRSRPDVETPSRLFTRLLADLADFQLFLYTNATEQVFQSWPAAVRRVGPNDCRIAASAIVHGFTVVTCNGKDFSRIPGVTFEDWSR